MFTIDIPAQTDTLISGYEDQNMTFGQIIAEARRKSGISQKDFAERIKKEDGQAISAQYLNDIERDRRNPPSEHMIAQFAKELGLSKNHLIAAAGALPA